MGSEWRKNEGNEISEIGRNRGLTSPPKKTPAENKGKGEKGKKGKIGAVLGIEPRPSRALSENHTTRPNSQLTL